MITEAIGRLRSKLTPQSPAAAYLGEIEEATTANLRAAAEAYRQAVLALSQDQKPEMPASEVQEMLRFLGVDDSQFAADIDRARQFAKHAATASQISALENAKAAAESELSAWTSETDSIIQEREPRRAELAFRFREAEDSLRSAREKIRQTPRAESLPDEFVSFLARIERLLQQSSRVVSNAHFEARSAERELASLKAAVKAADTPKQKADAKQELQKREPQLTGAVETSRSFEQRLQDLRAARDRAMTELICPQTGLFIGEIPASEFFADLNLADFSQPARDSF